MTYKAASVLWSFLPLRSIAQGSGETGVRVTVSALTLSELLEFCLCMFLFGKSKIKIFFNDAYSMAALIHRFGFRS